MSRARFIASITGMPHKRASLAAITHRIAVAHGYSLQTVMGTDRTDGPNAARQEVMATANRYGVSKAELARFFKRDWSTIHHGINAAERRT